MSADTQDVNIQQGTSTGLPSVGTLNSLGYLGAIPSTNGGCAKCQEIYALLNQHISECHKGDLSGNERDNNSVLNNVLMNILMLLTSHKNEAQPNSGQHAFDTSLHSVPVNSSPSFTIVASSSHPLPRSTSSATKTQLAEPHISSDGLVSAESLQKLLSSAQANHSKALAQNAADNEQRQTVLQGIPLMDTGTNSQGNLPLILTSHLQQDGTHQPTVVAAQTPPKVSEKPDLDVADILVNKMPIPSVNKEESSLAQLYLKQLAENLAAGRTDVLRQSESKSQPNNVNVNDGALVNALLNQNNVPASAIPASVPTTSLDNNNKPVVETISQILAAQKQLTSLLSLLGKRQNEPTLLPVAGLASQLVETPMNNPLFAGQQQQQQQQQNRQKLAAPGMLQIPLSSIIPALTPSSQGLIPTNLIPNNQSGAESIIHPQIANIFTKTSQGFQPISGAGAVALPALALNSTVIQNTPVPILQQTIQGALRGSGPQTVLLPSVIPGSMAPITTSITTSLLGTQSGLQQGMQPLLLPNRPLAQVVSQPTTTTKISYATVSQNTVPSLTEQLFQNSSNIPKLALSTVPSVFNLGNLPGMSILNPVLQNQSRNQGSSTVRPIPLLPTSTVIVPTSTQVVSSVDKIQGLISAALQNPGKSNTIIGSTAGAKSGVDASTGMYNKRRLSSISAPLKDGKPDGEEAKIDVPKKLYKCNTCGTTFSVLSTLQQHEQTHLGTKIQCNYCNDVFTDVTRYQEHISLHRGEENVHHCEYCNKLFTSRGELHKHLAEHTQKRPYKCKHCAKSFRDPGSLQKHERIHTGERPYRCTHCSRAFAEYSSLRKHNRVHTGEKPYKCPRCPKAFSISGNLQRHLFIHTGERPYRCTKCPKAFNNPSHLRRHVKNLHEGKKPSASYRKVESNVDSDSEMVEQDYCSMAKDEGAV